MWKIWKEEIYKIASRKIIWCGVLAVLAFLTFRLWTIQKDYTMTIDGQTYHGKTAIEQDKKLAQEYAGPLTKEKVMAIYERFGFSYYDYNDDGTGEFQGNFCSRFITENMTNFRQLEGGNPAEIQFMEGEEWENNVAPLLKGDVQFDYTYGWEDLKENYGITLMMLVSVILIIGLSPVFAEEYTLRTADILLTTKRGKKSAVWLKISAAVFFSITLYCLLSLYVWAVYGYVFGTQGLDASAVMCEVPYYGFCPKEIGAFFLFMFGLGFAGIILLSVMVPAVSAVCRNSFMAVVVSMILFVIPVVWIKIFSPMWLLGIKGTMTVNHFMLSMPVYLPLNWGFSFRGNAIAMHLLIALAAAVVCAAGGYHKYRNYQG